MAYPPTSTQTDAELAAAIQKAAAELNAAVVAARRAGLTVDLDIQDLQYGRGFQSGLTGTVTRRYGV